MNFVPQIPQSFCRAIKIPLRSSSQVKPLMRQRDLHDPFPCSNVVGGTPPQNKSRIGRLKP
jgi:hypothetical protein